MIIVPTAAWTHDLGDALACTGAALASRWQHRRWPEATARLAAATGPGYFLALGLGALAGAWLAGSANSLRALVAAPSHRSP